jgi:hypothetical protein
MRPVSVTGRPYCAIFLCVEQEMGAWFSTNTSAVTLPYMYGREHGWMQPGTGQPFGVGGRSYTTLARTMYKLPGREYDTWTFR